MESHIRKDAPRDANHGATQNTANYTTFAQTKIKLREYFNAQLDLPAESRDAEARELFDQLEKIVRQYEIDNGIRNDLKTRSPRELVKKHQRELSRRAQSFALIVRRLRRGEPALPSEWGFDHALVADKLEELHGLYQQASQAALESLRTLDALNANTNLTSRRSV